MKVFVAASVSGVLLVAPTLSGLLSKAACVARSVVLPGWVVASCWLLVGLVSAGLFVLAPNWSIDGVIEAFRKPVDLLRRA
jgi:hypothetical protein